MKLPATDDCNPDVAQGTRPAARPPEDKRRLRLTLPRTLDFDLPLGPTDRRFVRHPERWQSGRMCMIGNHV